jgi:hypothetical protein
MRLRGIESKEVVIEIDSDHVVERLKEEWLRKYCDGYFVDGDYLCYMQWEDDDAPVTKQARILTDEEKEILSFFDKIRKVFEK